MPRFTIPATVATRQIVKPLRICLVGATVLSTMMIRVCGDELSDRDLEFFESRIRPVLVEHCYECHNSSGTAEAGLALDYRGALLRGTDDGPVVGGDARKSRLLQVIRHEIDGLEMPEGGPKLDAQVIADFEAWVVSGAPDPRDRPPTAEELEQVISWDAIRESRKQWWSFLQIKRTELPATSAWSSQPIDRFVHQKLKKAGLEPSVRADRTTLVRRLYFALIGLPPTSAQVDEFVGDESDGAYDKLVDKLLRSKHFGEKWAKHWMDWIRYAESHGSEGDPRIDGAYQYRDYLIRGWNQDVPYDQLVLEHIAGDLLESPRINEELGINESIIGTSHWRMVFHGFAPTDALDEKVRFTDDAINAFTKAFLGLTVSCARCHDHKFDAISQADYYALFGIVGSTRPGRKAIELGTDLTRYDDELSQLKQRIRLSLADDWLSALESRLGNKAPTVAQSLPKFMHKALSLGEEERLSLGEKGRLRLGEKGRLRLGEKGRLRLGEKGRLRLGEKGRLRLSEEAGSAAGISRLREALFRNFEQYDASKRAFDRSSKTREWNLGTLEDYQQWYSYGTGLSDRPRDAGSFAIHVVGEVAVRGVYPAGVYSHLLSDKHGARLASEDFYLDEDQKLWLLMRGDGQAMSRYVVQDYPRNGTVFPVTELKTDQGWKWQSYDLDYWAGDEIHIELTTAKDAPLLVKNSNRSWFGIRRAVVVDSKGPLPPRDSLEHLRPIIDEMSLEPPGSEADICYQFIRATKFAVDAWKDGKANDSQALLLDACLAGHWLPNTLADLPTAGPLIEAYRRLEQRVPVATRVAGLAEWKGNNQPLFSRGDHKQPLDPIPRRFLEAIDATPYESDLSGRRELANDMLRDDNPLTARVIVNRIWHHLFGQGIVRTPDNFGRLGVEPTHPELLDHLALEFRTSDAWSLKSLIRKIVTSETWKQSSSLSSAATERDPENLFLSHYSLRRLDAEAIRDSLLSVSQKIDSAQFGPAVKGNSDRRSVYIQVIRNNLDPFLSAFDAPVPFSAKGRRDVTNVPAQSLLMLNDQRIRELAREFAVAAQTHSKDDSERVQYLWKTAFARSITTRELQESLTFLEEMEASYRARRIERERLEHQIVTTQRAVDAILNPIRERLIAERKQTTQLVDLKPIADWRFDSPQDSVSGLELELMGSARIENGELVLDGQGWAQSPPLATDLNGKTLEVVVQLSSLGQRGGGVLTVQNVAGDVFDSIVFAEQKKKTWLSGSDHFRRTKPIEGPPESEALERPVHLALVYEPEGKVTLFRDGKPYGSSYTTQLQPFAKEDTVILLGMRHGSSLGQGRMLSGRILEARLYDRALSASEIQQAATGLPTPPSREQLLAELSEIKLRELDILEEGLMKDRHDLESVQIANDPHQHWTDLAHSIFNMKEFIYVR